MYNTCVQKAGKIMSKNFSFIKTHLLSHIVDQIQRKGPTRNYTTALGEGGHVQLKKDYQFGTNHRAGYEEKVS
jgi:hypothetical protein